MANETATQALRVFDNDYEKYVAESWDDLRAVYEETYGPNSWEHHGKDGDWSETPPDRPVTIHFYEEKEIRTQAAAEWAREKGRGFLCGQE